MNLLVHKNPLKLIQFSTEIENIFETADSVFQPIKLAAYKTLAHVPKEKDSHTKTAFQKFRFLKTIFHPEFQIQYWKLRWTC